MSRMVPARTGALVDSRGVRRGEWNGPSHLEAADVAFELGSGQAAAAADVDGSQLAGLHERVHGRPSDAEDVRSLLGRQQEGLGGQYVTERLRITHVVQLLAVAMSARTVSRGPARAVAMCCLLRGWD